MAHQRPEIATENPDAINTSVAKMVVMPKIRQSMSDLVAPSPISGRNHSTKTIQARPALTAYSTVHAKFMAPLENQATTPIENVGSSNKLVGQAPKTKIRGLKAMMATRSPNYRIQEGKRNFLPR